MSESRKIQKSDEQWRQSLSAMQFRVLRQAFTEPAFTGLYWNEKKPGTYVCAGCQTPLFRSEQKFDSGCGWPSFFDELEGQVIELKLDRSHGMVRQEILCRACGGHLGHVFDDGPRPTGRRYCVNSASVVLVEDGENPASGGE